MTGRRLLMVVGLAGLSLGLAHPAMADSFGAGGATFSQGGLQAGTGYWQVSGAATAQAAGPANPVVGYGGAEVYTSPIDGAVWQGVGTSSAAQAGCGAAGGTVQAASSAPAGTAQYVLVGWNGDPIATEAITCAPGPGGGAALSPPPPPPTGSQVWQSASGWEPLVLSGIEVDPGGLGLTGLSSWFWLSNPTTRLPTLVVSIRGYSVTASAAITSYTWIFGDGDSATSYSPGSESQPAASYTYQTKGLYQVSVIAHYVGSYTFAGHGLTPKTAPLNVDVTMGTMSYGVQEARSVLTPPDGQAS